MTAHSEGAHDLGHVIPYKIYLSVLIFLLVLTVITVAVSRVDFGTFNIVVAMLIASVKAGVVGAYFMHLKYENPVIWIYVAFPIVLLFIMIGGIFLDNPHRIDPKIHYEHPKVEGAAAAHH